MKAIKRIFIFSLALVMALIFSVPSFAHSKDGIDDKVNSTASYLMKTVFNPAFGNVGGDWVVIALSQSGVSVPKSYYESYYKTVEDYVKSVNGVLHQKKYTDYSRTVLALTAMGYDATDVGGYNLVYPLGDFEKTIWQGINGPIWSLIALDSGNYEIPENKEASIQATRDLYIEEILANQLNDGGWAFGAKDKSYSSDPDMTGMALSALAKYKDQAKVKSAIDDGLVCLSKLQNDQGGFASWGTVNSESCAQVIVALSALGIDFNDSRFVKNGNTLLDNILTFEVAGGGFAHVLESSGGYVGGAVNQMATEQAFYALVAANRAMEGKSFLYDMTSHFDYAKLHKTEEKIATEPVLGPKADPKSEPVVEEKKEEAEVITPVEKTDEKTEEKEVAIEKDTVDASNTDESVDSPKKSPLIFAVPIVLVAAIVIILVINKRR